ncbi:MAG: family 1 glycosylhydrolase, partial [Defluviitaleaceae bacterium]|nr:family 1 glycosylhydrolase [Defluviitaleaceae bacterium]
MGFNKNFVWGAATASYQIEGDRQGRGQSVWDECAHRPGFVQRGATGDVACDHVNRMDEDISIMDYLGLGAYRFSFAWPRIMPDGLGALNPKGLEFYDRLIDKLLEKNITPWATMFHWDYPVALYRRGGWLNPDSPKWFAEYAQILADRYSDRVENWITLNEPQCFIDLGHRRGFHAPGLQLPFDQVLLAAHNALLAHGMALSVLRARAKKPAKVGFSPSSRVIMPYTEKDVDLARRISFEIRDLDLFISDSWWCDAVFLGRYPESGMKLYERFLPEIGADDMKIIGADVDF